MQNCLDRKNDYRDQSNQSIGVIEEQIFEAWKTKDNTAVLCYQTPTKKAKKCDDVSKCENESYSDQHFCFDKALFMY